MVNPTGPEHVRVLGGQGTVIGDGNTIYQTFTNAPASISSHIRVREFATIVAERTRGFVGREFVFAAVERLLVAPGFDSGYVVIRGEPGIGKTSLIAELVRRHGHVHHFNVALQNIRSAHDFLSNVCAQLVVRYGLSHAALPPEATAGGGFLSRLLAEAVEKAPDRRVVLLIDALDEADDLGVAVGANRLFLPAVLPDGVHIVATSREVHDYRLAVDSMDEIALRDDDPHNRQDIAQYVRDFVQANHDPMRERLAGWGTTVEEFADLLTARSQGNFMYLVAVLRDIRSGRIDVERIGDLEQLPRGLRAYYLRHWRAMMAADPELFRTLYEPVICMLAVAHEPVSAADLSRWTGLSPNRVRGVLRDWREFLNEERTDGAPTRYRLYHASFQDFLRDEVALDEYHEAIAAAALGKLGL
ncbi:ATP-binding protein [Actinoplanes sp. TBRC 11911]|uniref:AAA family ATPase n=1 Tax=Actinoplanes sp. TBRC 11911 TaxID=2729386 RepID=UPI00145F4C87|nr:AAA family ATPase [Actinoplanes sp. TBRC 11911]NMO53707.1 ATP-binding protein [Actinoplanes sp. TBRC 11911]